MSVDLALRDRTVLVTGGSGGVGRELVRAFAAEGARVAFTYHSDRSTAEELEREGEGRVLAVPHRMGADDDVHDVVRAVNDWGGPIQVLVNNALFQPEAPALDIGELDALPWREMLRLNVETAVEFSAAALRQMRDTGWGRIVQVSSSLVSQGKKGFEFYGAAKAALHGFNRSLAFSAGDADILCNVVVLGLTRTQTNVGKPWFPEYHDEFVALSPRGRLVDAADVATMVVVLGSGANQVVNGQDVHVSGGAVVR
ncbi:SDR family oxidoreductase [Streptomyces sp. SID7499]|uniref:SDR family oxidoreductase n=1 Tax=Streptomyces sp. SID7499 TaxID=2706086 RepID=A0A6G3XI13_9ACTN|nr:SDR family oxidoreductase [Streptomyces sp. SID7499]